MASSRSRRAVTRAGLDRPARGLGQLLLRFGVQADRVGRRQECLFLVHCRRIGEPRIGFLGGVSVEGKGGNKRGCGRGGGRGIGRRSVSRRRGGNRRGGNRRSGNRHSGNRHSGNRRVVRALPSHLIHPLPPGIGSLGEGGGRTRIAERFDRRTRHVANRRWRAAGPRGSGAPTARAILVVPEVPEQRQHDRRPEPERHGGPEDGERQHARHDDDRHPGLPGPLPGRTAEQIVEGRRFPTVDGDEQPAGQVEDDSDATAESKQHRAHPDQHRVDPPVPGHAAAKTRQLRVGHAAANSPDRHAHHPAELQSPSHQGRPPVLPAV